MIARQSAMVYVTKQATDSPREKALTQEVTPAMIEAGAAVVCEWFPFDGERPAISQTEAQALVRAILAALSAPASAS